MTSVLQLEELDVSTDKRARFDELAVGTYVEQVIAANRLYLTAAIGDPLGTERSYWALSCLPRTHGGNRFSTLSMSTMETFVLHKPVTVDEAPTGFVVVSRRVLDAAGPAFDADDLEVGPSKYAAAGDDQCHVRGTWPALTRALAGRLGERAPLRDAARELATRLTRGTGTSYSRYHNPYLAARVLGRPVPVDAGAGGR
ncbi:hypothetical protein Q0Z83_037410 [Actinoplanes sichuanensis]|uniref:Uncharacterized protein n=1 Tax=Actinoplanes sichuanensis TaxID=512349 RepID=A0ABW4A390_9ACTN|nr:hypothetical protein [Actinoplanes sichuanensis]BEL05550.1 hypothetical protein Q0Z83_037410 [Actinoplanes sichuanensis]